MRVNDLLFDSKYTFGDERAADKDVFKVTGLFVLQNGSFYFTVMYHRTSNSVQQEPSGDIISHLIDSRRGICICTI